MNSFGRGAQSRRAVLIGGAGLLAGAAAVGIGFGRGDRHDGIRDGGDSPILLPSPDPHAPVAVAMAASGVKGPRPALMRRALAALDRHGTRVPRRDRIMLVDFSKPSHANRLHVVDLVSGSTWSSLVSHGSGSDPERTGWVQRTSNVEGSNASCEGAFTTADLYVGRHGRSQRIIGLDDTNDNALRRAIVVHGAWYAEAGVARETGALGRSQGCFAVGDTVLPDLLERLGPGRMIYASRA